jgi:hypothetical protein
MKNFSIFKNTKKKEGSTQPDYKMSVKMGEEYVDCGSCWLKDGKSGKYFSCKLNDVYVDHTKNVARKGFELTLDPSNGNEMPDIPEEAPQTPTEAPF